MASHLGPGGVIIAWQRSGMGNAMLILSWNVRGRGAPEKRSAIRDLILSSNCDIILIQEEKVVAPSSNFFVSLGGAKLDEWCCLDANGTAGGLLIRWNSQIDLPSYCRVVLSSTEWILLFVFGL